jgi:hypothetical protein
MHVVSMRVIVRRFRAVLPGLGEVKLTCGSLHVVSGRSQDYRKRFLR